MTKQQKGKLGEDKAVQMLESRGYIIIERNYRTKWGEIDIIALKNKILIFIEVKVLGFYDQDCLEYLINHRKRRRIKMLSRHFLANNSKYLESELRFDVIIFQNHFQKVKHFKNAF